MRPLLLLLLPACTRSGDDGLDDTDAPDVIPCDDITSRLDPDEVSPLGFSGADVLTPIAAARTTAATWPEPPREGETTVTIAVAGNGDPTFHERSVSEDADTDALSDADPACPDQLEVPVLVTFGSADGAFDEALPMSVWALTASDPVSGSVPLDVDALTGTYTIEEIDPSAWDDVELSFENTWGPDATLTGQVSISARRMVGDVGEGFVGPVLRWPAE